MHLTFNHVYTFFSRSFFQPGLTDSDLTILRRGSGQCMVWPALLRSYIIGPATAAAAARESLGLARRATLHHTTTTTTTTATTATTATTTTTTAGSSGVWTAAGTARHRPRAALVRQHAAPTQSWPAHPRQASGMEATAPSPPATAAGEKRGAPTAAGAQQKSRKLPAFPEVPMAPTYRPTDEEFADPMVYILKIKPEAEKFGICKVGASAARRVPGRLHRARCRRLADLAVRAPCRSSRHRPGSRRGRSTRTASSLTPASRTSTSCRCPPRPVPAAPHSP